MLQCFVIQCLLHEDHEELALNHEALNHEALKHKDHEALALLQCFIIQCFVLPMLMLRDLRASNASNANASCLVFPKENKKRNVRNIPKTKNKKKTYS